MKTVWGGKTLPEEIKMTSQSGDKKRPWGGKMLPRVKFKKCKEKLKKVQKKVHKKVQKKRKITWTKKVHKIVQQKVQKIVNYY